MMFLPLALLHLLVLQASALSIEANLLKAIPIYDVNKPNGNCTALALDSKYFITTHICATRTSNGGGWLTLLYKEHPNDQDFKQVTGRAEYDGTYTVGGDNDFVVGEFKSKLVKFTKLKIPRKPSVGKYVIGWDNLKSTKTLRRSVKIEKALACKNFIDNEYFEFNGDHATCGKLDDSHRTDIDVGAVMIDASENPIGLLSIMNFSGNRPSVAAFTKLSAYCDRIKSDTKGSFTCQ